MLKFIYFTETRNLRVVYIKLASIRYYMCLITLKAIEHIMESSKYNKGYYKINKIPTCI